MTRSPINLHVFHRIRKSAFQVLLAALMLALLPVPAVSAESPAATPNETISYAFTLTAAMKADREGAPVCVGDEVTFLVRAWRQGTAMDSKRDIPRQPAFGVKIDASSNQPDKLALTSQSQYMTSIDLEMPGGVEFTFKAKKPGQAQVVFEAMFPEKQVDKATRKGLDASALRNLLYADVTSKVSVIECPLTLNVVNQYLMEPSPMRQFIVTAIKDARLMPSDSKPNLLIYEGLETVVISAYVPECEVSWKKVERFVRIEATKGEKGYHVAIERGPVDLSVTYVCGDDSSTAYLPIPEGGVQEWDVPVKGGIQTRTMRLPMTTMWYFIEARTKKN